MDLSDEIMTLVQHGECYDSLIHPQANCKIHFEKGF